jgi:hypothetical protein
LTLHRIIIPIELIAAGFVVDPCKTSPTLSTIIVIHRQAASQHIIKRRASRNQLNPSQLISLGSSHSFDGQASGCASQL